MTVGCCCCCCCCCCFAFQITIVHSNWLTDWLTPCQAMCTSCTTAAIGPNSATQLQLEIKKEERKCLLHLWLIWPVPDNEKPIRVLLWNKGTLQLNIIRNILHIVERKENRNLLMMSFGQIGFFLFLDPQIHLSLVFSSSYSSCDQESGQAYSSSSSSSSSIVVIDWSFP